MSASLKKTLLGLVGLFLLLDIVAVLWYLRPDPRSGPPNLPPSIASKDGQIPANVAKQITGQVTASSATSITVAPVVPTAEDAGETRAVPGTPFVVSITKQQTYTLTAATTIVKQVLLDRATFESKLKAYQDAVAKDPATAGSPPRAFTEIKLTPSALTEGLLVTVTPTTADSNEAQTVLIVSAETPSN